MMACDVCALLTTDMLQQWDGKGGAEVGGKARDQAGKGGPSR